MVFSASSSIVKAIVVILLVLIGNSTSALAARPGRTTSMIHQFPLKPETEKFIDYQQQDQPKPVTSFRYRGRMFGFFPKGSKVSPSGPSKRHNAVVASAPKS